MIDIEASLDDLVNINEGLLTAMIEMVSALRAANEINERRADLDLRMTNIHIQALELARVRGSTP